MLQVERALGDELRRAEARLEHDLEKAESDARRTREEGEQRLKQVVLDAERQAVRDVEAKARDRVSETRVRIQRWIDATEREAETALQRAMELLTQDGDEGADA